MGNVKRWVDRYQCTPETPWTPKVDGFVEHSDVHEVGKQRDGWPCGDMVTYECRNCGHKWDAELPQ